MEGSSLASGTTVPSMEAVSQSTTPGFSSQFMHHTSNPSRHPAPIACFNVNPYNLTSYVDTPCWVSHADAVASWPPFLVNGEQHQQVYQQYHQQQFIPHQLPQAKEVESNNITHGGSDVSRISPQLMTFPSIMSDENNPMVPMANYSNFGSCNLMNDSCNFPDSSFLPQIDWSYMCVNEMENNETEILQPYNFSVSDSEASGTTSPMTNVYISPIEPTLNHDTIPSKLIQLPQTLTPVDELVNGGSDASGTTTPSTKCYISPKSSPLQHDTIPSKFIHLPQTLTPVDELAHRDGSAGINTSVTNSDISPDTSLKHTSTKYIQLPGSLLSASGLSARVAGTPSEATTPIVNTNPSPLNHGAIPSKLIQLPQTLTPVDELAHRDGSAGINTSVTNSDISPDTSLKHTSTKYIQLPGSLLSSSGHTHAVDRAPSEITGHLTNRHIPSPFQQNIKPSKFIQLPESLLSSSGNSYGGSGTCTPMMTPNINSHLSSHYMSNYGNFNQSSMNYPF
eukprot:Tbor_TRINITY_DN6078_c0_g1::TRINITY_DN6078_c0_g1_i14::g.10282::m.10282